MTERGLNHLSTILTYLEHDPHYQRVQNCTRTLHSTVRPRFAYCHTIVRYIFLKLWIMCTNYAESLTLSNVGLMELKNYIQSPSINNTT
jgi:hypothetical protein